MQHREEESDFDRFVSELREEIDEQERTLYSDQVIEEARNPKNMGCMPDPDARGLVHGWCGDTMEIYLRLNGESVEQATFTTDGCGATLACGSMITQMVTGMSLKEAGRVGSEDLVSALGGLPEESAHCAELAVNTLHNALFNWRERNES